MAEADIAKFVEQYHTNATALIVAAARKSGFLREVAAALCVFDKTASQASCHACRLLEDLTDLFDKHVCLPTITWESFGGDGCDLPACSEKEIAPYLVFNYELADDRCADGIRVIKEND